MPNLNDSGYFSSRMDEEVERGDQATNKIAGTRHYELALRYGILAAQCAAGAPQVLSFQNGMAHLNSHIMPDAAAAA